MTMLERIFQGYYEDRLDGEKADPEAMRKYYSEISKGVEYSGQRKMEESSYMHIMENVSLYGREAEKTGFMAGFRMAWELLRNMQEVTS